jgi:hypothetical protein
MYRARLAGFGLMGLVLKKVHAGQAVAPKLPVNWQHGV